MENYKNHVKKLLEELENEYGEIHLDSFDINFERANREVIFSRNTQYVRY